MQIMWPLILSSIAGFSSMLGCIGIFIPTKKKDSFITFSISLSLSVMLMVSIFDLIPSSLPNIGTNILNSIVIFILFFSIGVAMVSLLNKAIEKEKGKSSGNANLYKLGILSFIALVLHNLPEGILTFMSTYQDFNLGVSLCIAIALHNIPEGVSIAVPIYYSTGSIGKAVKYTFLSALAEPIGALLAFMILKDFITNQMISIFLILVAGIMVTLSIEKMWPEALSYHKKKAMLSGLILGAVIVLASIFIL